MPLQPQSRPLEPQIFVPADKPPYQRLHQNDVLLADVTAQLFQVRDLPSAEEDLRVAQPVLVRVGQPVAHNVRAGGLHVPVHDLDALAQQPVALVKVLVGPSRREAGRRDADRLEHAACPQLLHDLGRLPLESGLVLVGLEVKLVEVELKLSNT